MRDTFDIANSTAEHESLSQTTANAHKTFGALKSQQFWINTTTINTLNPTWVPDGPFGILSVQIKVLKPTSLLWNIFSVSRYSAECFQRQETAEITWKGNFL